MSTEVKSCPSQNSSVKAHDIMTGAQFRLIDLIDDMCAGKDVFFRLVRVAADIMTRNVKTLTLDDKVETCLQFMKDNKVRHVPVMDPPTEEGQKPVFVGVVSGRDISRHLSPYVGKIGQEQTDVKALREPLTQIITRKPKSVSPDTPMSEVLKTMIDNHVDMVPVLRDGDLVGLVTTADILKLFVRMDKIRQLCQSETTIRRRIRFTDLTSPEGLADVGSFFSSSCQTVNDIMTEHPDYLEEGDNIAKAIDIMQKGKFRHLPILNKEMKVVGIISDRNILRHLPGPRKQSAVDAEQLHHGLFAVNPKDPSLRVAVTTIMTIDVVHVLPSCSIYQAARTMYDEKISSLVVIDESKKLQGIVTMTDLMRGVLAAYELTAKRGA